MCFVPWSDLMAIEHDAYSTNQFVATSIDPDAYYSIDAVLPVVVDCVLWSLAMCADSLLVMETENSE
jgi:hypothetical protein